MNDNKKQIFIILLVIIVVAIGVIFFIKKEGSNTQNSIDDSKGEIQENSTTGVILNERSGDYYSSTSPSVTTPLPENFEEKLKSQGKISSLSLNFDSESFLDDELYKFDLRSNIKILIDASNTGLPDGTNLDLSIPGANFNSKITIPGRYSYGVFFQKTGNQEITLKGEGLKDGEISKTIVIR